MNLKNLLVVFSIMLFACSCRAPRNIAYLQGIDTLTAEQLASMRQMYVPRITAGDMLTITVSALDPATVVAFNPPLLSYKKPGATEVGVTQQIQTYHVDNDGNINFPVFGKVRVTGLSQQELNELLQSKIGETVESPIVNSQIVNYKVTVAGEVAEPQEVEVPNGRITILDAIGKAGDLLITGDRESVVVYRDNNGTPEFGRLDLTDPNIVASPYFYLKQNDYVYVEPNDSKKLTSGFSETKQYNLTLFSAMISAISAIVTIIVVFK